MVFTKYTLFAERNVFYGKKSSRMKIFLLKKTFLTEKNLNVKNRYLISKIYFYTENILLQIKYKSFLNIYSFCKKIFFDHKKYIC